MTDIEVTAENHEQQEHHVVHQNLPLCILIMSISGLLRVLATMVLAFPDYLAKKRGKPIGGTDERKQKIYSTLFIVCHVLLLAIAAVMSIVGTFFGPVSIAIPVQTGSALLFNVVVMGIVLKMRSFDKSQRTGTYIVVFSVLSLIDVGPGLQNNQDVVALLSKTSAMIWALFLTCVMIGAAICTYPLTKATNLDSENFNFFQRHSFVILTIGGTVSNVGMATAGKTLGILEGPAFLVGLVYYVISALLGLVFSIVSATSCDQGVFTPLSSVTLIIVNMITGIVIWQDWMVINTWIGYISACMLMCCGVYLLAEVDMLQTYMSSKVSTIAQGGPVLGNNNDESSNTFISNDVEAWQQCLQATPAVSNDSTEYSGLV